MFSKELLSEVLGYTPYKISGIKPVGGIGERTLVLENEDGTVRAYWNIYELAHKCKEWAMTKECTLFSGWDYEVGVWNCLLGRHDSQELPSYQADTEPEAIFKACQWILEKIGLEKL